MTTDWVISAMECRVHEENMDDVVIIVHWRYQARELHEEKEYFAETYGATSVGMPDPETFTPYDQLTKEQVVGWLEAELDVDQMNTSLQENIDLQINPITVTLPPAWQQNVQ